MNLTRSAFVILVLLLRGGVLSAAENPAVSTHPPEVPLETQFRELPMESRRLTGPLFWLHGTQSADRIRTVLQKVAEGGNGCFTAEARAHKGYWFTDQWFTDLSVTLEEAKRQNLKMWIFDEGGWPSGMVGGKLPFEYSAKKLVSTDRTVEGPAEVEEAGCGEAEFIGAVAGRVVEGDAIDPASLIDLAPYVRDGHLKWLAPEGRWRVMKFSFKRGGSAWGKTYLVDGASRDCVDWYLKAAFEPIYARHKQDFGKTIQGFFYDEPQTQGDWGTEVPKVLAERSIDWKLAYVAKQYKLSGEAQTAALYAYNDALWEAWGRTLYGGISRWCHERGVRSMGHFNESVGNYLNAGYGAGNIFQQQKYSDMGGIDAIYQQFSPFARQAATWQTPKLASSISHVYGKEDDVAFVEIFGARGQELTYSEMKFWTDHMQVSGINFLVPHSFNPSAPYDRDCPPFFYNGGFEPRWPLYRVFADYTNRLSVMLSGGRHVCPIAFLFPGNSRYIGSYVLPDGLSEAIQDALYDCDWLPYDVFEQESTVEGKQLTLLQERYRVLIVPPVEFIPYGALAKAKAFLDAGGVVIGYGALPSRSATLGKSAADIAVLRDSIWGTNAQPGVQARVTGTAGGRSYFLPEKPTAQTLAAVLKEAGVKPALQVLSGETGNNLHVLNRVKDGKNIYFVANQNYDGQARNFTLRADGASGIPEAWDALRNEITSLPYRADASGVTFDLTLEPNESVLIVFNDHSRPLPPRTPGLCKDVASFPIQPDPNFKARTDPVIEKINGNQMTDSPVFSQEFQGTCKLPASLDTAKVRAYLEFDGYPNPPQRLEIVKAVYTQRKPPAGQKPAVVDLTKQVAAAVRDGSIRLPITPALFDGHPPAGSGRLKIEYQVENKNCWTDLAIGDTLVLPVAQDAASVTVNGKAAGGLIGKPYRLDVTRWITPGINTIRTEPWSPVNPRLVLYPTF